MHRICYKWPESCKQTTIHLSHHSNQSPELTFANILIKLNISSCLWKYHYWQTHKHTGRIKYIDDYLMWIFDVPGMRWRHCPRPQTGALSLLSPLQDNAEEEFSSTANDFPQGVSLINYMMNSCTYPHTYVSFSGSGSLIWWLSSTSCIMERWM